ncbi:MAG TPA: CAP domain-containing protein [Candidatus Binatia bacterium]|nr:CAP domain-containing protein [Candidatus Binatia bacterium]
MMWVPRTALLAAVAIALMGARTPTNDEYALLVLANQSRANPAADGGTEPVVPPMRWSDQLAAAAQAHTDDMVAHTYPGHTCFQHNSCNGQLWSTRVGSFYPGWAWLGENIGSGLNDPRYMHTGWMRSPDHRANLLSGAFNDFGSAFGSATDNFGPLPLATEDFGSKGLLSLGSSAYPTIPAGAAVLGAGAGTHELIVNYWHYHGGPPQMVVAILGDECVPMALNQGTPTHGTYHAFRTWFDCTPFAFQAVRSDGVVVRWPAVGGIIAGDSDASCVPYSATRPTKDCLGPSSTPAPGATPTPTPVPMLGHVRFTARDHDTTGRDYVRLVVDLPRFDPAGVSIGLFVKLNGTDYWSAQMPVLAPDQKRRAWRTRGASLRPTGAGYRLYVTQTAAEVARPRPGVVDLTVSLPMGDLTARAAAIVHGHSVTASRAVL